MDVTVTSDSYSKGGYVGRGSRVGAVVVAEGPGSVASEGTVVGAIAGEAVGGALLFELRPQAASKAVTAPPTPNRNISRRVNLRIAVVTITVAGGVGGVGALV